LGIWPFAAATLWGVFQRTEVDTGSMPRWAGTSSTSFLSWSGFDPVPEV